MRNNYVKLANRIAVYIPSTINVSVSFSTDSIVDECAGLLSKLFGGATITEAQGCWISETAGLVKESVKVVYSYCSNVHYSEAVPQILEYAEGLKIQLSQEAIAVELNNKLFLV
jgi:hypothetical protein